MVSKSEVRPLLVDRSHKVFSVSLFLPVIQKNMEGSMSFLKMYFVGASLNTFFLLCILVVFVCVVGLEIIWIMDGYGY